MPVDPERQASYDQLRERFLNDPDFRAAVTADPTGALEGVLGPLTAGGESGRQRHHGDAAQRRRARRAHQVGRGGRVVTVSTWD